MLSKIQNFIIPSFLKRFDFWLLTHKPHIWRTRGHFVVFFGAVAAILFFWAGLSINQTLYDLHSELGKHKFRELNFSFSFMSCLIFIGSMFGWLFSIQKFQYKRTNIKHFFLEIAIYTIGIFTLWTMVWAFELGFDYKQSFLLEKNNQADKDWFFKNDFSNFGYMPHYDPSKIANPFPYFKKGEELLHFQKQRNTLTQKFRKENNKDSDFTFMDSDSGSDLNCLNWEFRSLNRSTLPPQYKKHSDYINTLISNDSIREQERNKLKVEDHVFIFDKLIAGYNFDEILEISENTYPRFYHHINFKQRAQSLLTPQIAEWANQAQFLESLNTDEEAIYTAFLKELYEDYRNYDTVLVSIQQVEILLVSKFYHHLESEERKELKLLNLDLDFQIYNRLGDFYIENEDKANRSLNKLRKVLEHFDIDSKQKYFFWLGKMKSNFSKENTKDAYVASLVDAAYTTLKPTKIDSLLMYDYYTLKLKNFDTYTQFFTKIYQDYSIQKYSKEDYDRLFNLLTVNGFPNKTPQYKTQNRDKISLLIYSEDYRKAINSLESKREDNLEFRILVFSGFSLIYCFLGAITFYIISLSTGIQFWIASFISGVYWAILAFIGQLFNWGRSYENGGYTETISIPLLFITLQAIIFFVFITLLLLKKYQWQKAGLMINAVVLSGLISVFFTVQYILDYIISSQRALTNEYYRFSFRERITLIEIVIIGYCLIYIIIARLLKRHLTLPKKK